jgi:hypothetical protein
MDRDVLLPQWGKEVKTHYVDQTDLASLEALGAEVGDELDLVIDDGLHAPHANLAVLLFALPRIKLGGHIVIEDIPPMAAPIWTVTARLLPDNFVSTLWQTKAGLAFMVRRVV